MLTEKTLIPLIPNLKNRAKLYTKDHEDLVQDTLLKAWANKDKFTSDPLKFLFCIMKHLHFDNLRKPTTIPPFNAFQMPNQISVVALNECAKLANIDLAINNALGYSLEDMDTSIKRSSMYKAIKNIHSMKEEYV